MELILFDCNINITITVLLRYDAITNDFECYRLDIH